MGNANCTEGSAALWICEFGAEIWINCQTCPSSRLKLLLHSASAHVKKIANTVYFVFFLKKPGEARPYLDLLKSKRVYVQNREGKN
jgi:hypothetical protein